MCIFCSAVEMEKLNPREFWSLWRELEIANDEKHGNALMDKVFKTSEEYQVELSKYAFEGE